MSVVVVCSMRNEGAFLLEWVVWYRMLGFSSIVAVTNDCTDHSPQLLDLLEQAGWVEHLRCDIKAGRGGIVPAKLAAAGDLKTLRRARTVMVCDVDEFLVIHRGAGLIGDLLSAPGRDYLGMSINWRVFGSGGILDYADSPVHQQFRAATGRKRDLNRGVKSVHHHPRWFRRLGDHGPVGLDLAKARKETGSDWGQGGLVWVAPSGKPLTGWTPDGPYFRITGKAEIDHSVAQINHYMLRSAETFSLKSGTLSPSAGRDRYTATYWATADRRDDTDDSALRYGDRFAALHRAALELPGVARLHYQCCADHVAAIAGKAGRRPEDDPRHAAFLAKTL